MSGAPENVPTVSCTRCNDEWTLAYELDELGLGNGALEAFAIDHREHTGHYPDGVTPWVADCRHCPDGVERIDETAVRRWARTHTRHTNHEIDLSYEDETERVTPE